MRTYDKVRFFVLAFGLATLVPDLTKAQSKVSLVGEQVEFCEDNLPSAVLPPSVVAAVMRSREGRQAEADALANQIKLDFAALLTGTTVHLSTGRSKFFLVTGKGDLSGADNAWFWVVRESGGNAVALSWFGANCLRIKEIKTHGARDIVTFWSSAAVRKMQTYKFDGNSYRLICTRQRNNY